MSNPTTATALPTETVIVPSFSVANSPVKSIQATNLDGSQTVDFFVYVALGTEPLALMDLSQLRGVAPGATAIAQGIDTNNLSKLEIRATASGAGASVRVATA